MSSTSAEINALSAITTIDLYKRFINKDDNPSKDVMMSKLLALVGELLQYYFHYFLLRNKIL